MTPRELAAVAVWLVAGLIAGSVIAGVAALVAQSVTK